MGVVVDAWNLGITTLYILKRMVTLIGCAFIFIGRIDIPFLSVEADEIGPARLDLFPFVFRKDLLMHDAHRHPYLERLGLFYMMKLRYGDHFGREAGSCWRLLFVFALFPWLRKFRIRATDTLQFDQVKFSRDATFEAFSALAAKGTSRRFPGTLAPIEETEGEDCSSNSESAIEDLRRIINNLKEENSNLMQENERLMQKYES